MKGGQCHCTRKAYILPSASEWRQQWRLKAEWLCNWLRRLLHYSLRGFLFLGEVLLVSGSLWSADLLPSSGDASPSSPSVTGSLSALRPLLVGEDTWSPLALSASSWSSERPSACSGSSSLVTASVFFVSAASSYQTEAANRVESRRVESKRVESRRVESRRVESKRVESRRVMWEEDDVGGDNVCVTEPTLVELEQQ